MHAETCLIHASYPRGVGIDKSPSGEEYVYKEDLSGGPISGVITHIVNDIVSTMTEVCDPTMLAVSPCDERGVS